jgi:hypothetical protein
LALGPALAAYPDQGVSHVAPASVAITFRVGAPLARFSGDRSRARTPSYS